MYLLSLVLVKKEDIKIKIILILLSIGYCVIATAQVLPTFTLTMQDGKFLPSDVLRVPTGQRIRLLVNNKGLSAAEFESPSLRKEKVLAPGANSFLIIAPLAPGEYAFFDDFHPSAKGVLIAE
ncbi:MAG: cupredoxin domain-containing protein [Gammaproteobacteria bacterium]|uniref:cupredoxin domain-containing protein n=1 Tax=Nitrosomonas sp. TaxID=42353 RepID=UPI001DDA29B5|nr:cupredoxin domain-containing protein [Nitrosomonas sp.]MBX9637773.1 cupredoxin domain-containing protein [Nitrosomonas sp.]MBY0377792.1 cupredoxin domain-containing protein [Gammaproteobacteria bacterium]MBY0484462.1 cupredoxin domain-containing protein [Nitrosomonas sp.]MBY0544372.1 cupredoxin domain-containing protein [Gammaproteobacteria bacterium]